jgi:hypothetical protein
MKDKAQEKEGDYLFALFVLPLGSLADFPARFIVL